MPIYHLVTNQANILPATYSLTITATQTGYSSLTANVPVTVNASAAPPPITVDTVRTITELLTIIWRDGQAVRQLTAQDCRDTILSLALQTTDFSRLPRSSVGLTNGRAWLDSLGVVRVFLVRDVGEGLLTTFGRGALIANATPRAAGNGALNGAGVLSANAIARERAAGTFGGVGGLVANGLRLRNSATFAGAGGFTADSSSAFTTEFTTEFH